jgi:hypothetical protein
MEAVIVLLIIGALFLTISGAKYFITLSKAIATASQIDMLATKIKSFHEIYDCWPGEANLATQASSITLTERFFNDLIASNLVQRKHLTPSLGGIFFIENENGSYYLLLADNIKKNATLTPTEAQLIFSKLAIAKGEIINKNGSCIIKITLE